MMLVLFFLFALGQIGRVSLYNGQVNFYLYEVVMSAMLLQWVSRYGFILFNEAWAKFRWIFYFLGALLLSYLISIYKFNLFDNLVAGLYLLRVFLYFIFFFYFTNWMKITRNSKRLTRNAVLLFSILTVATSLAQYFFYPDLRNLYYLGWDPHLFRIFGVFFDTSITAAIFGTLILHFIFARNYWLLGIYSIMGLLTFSRSLYLSILPTIVFYLISQKLWKTIAVVIAVFIAGLIIIPKPFGEGVNLRRTFTIESRLQDNQKAIELWKTSPAFGVGYNRLGALKGANLESHARASFPSSFLIILSTTGILGLIAFSMMLKNLAMVSNNSKWYVLFLSIFSLFDNILLHPFILFLSLSLLAYEISPSRNGR